MKTLVLSLALLSATTPAFASTLRCTIQSGTQKATSSLDLETLKKGEGNLGSDGVYDLSFGADVSCKKDKCDVLVVITSSKIEDEVGEISFSFDKNQNGRVHGEPLDGAPDGKKYAFYCYVD